MLRNDYRRALIMLRTIEKGYSGHARLERRTLMGTLSFVVSTPDTSEERLYAALIGRRSSNYFAAALGELRRDSRGQYGLNASFDPRNVESRELDSYQLVAIVAVNNGHCSLVLTGNMNGSEEMDLNRVQQSACALFSTDQTTSQSQDTSQRLPVELGKIVPVFSGPDAIEQSEEEALELEFGSMEAVELDVYTTETIEMDSCMMEAVEPDFASIEATEAEIEDMEAAETDCSSMEAIELEVEIESDSEAMEAETEAAELEEQSEYLKEAVEESDCTIQEAEIVEEEVAVELEVEFTEQLTLDTNIDTSSPWPEEVEPLRTLFKIGDLIQGPSIAGYTFVQAPMPSESGYAHVAIGLRFEGSAPISVCYGLPASYAVEPPAGLEDYEWSGNSNQGWWIRFANLMDT